MSAGGNTNRVGMLVEQEQEEEVSGCEEELTTYISPGEAQRTVSYSSLAYIRAPEFTSQFIDECWTAQGRGCKEDVKEQHRVEQWIQCNVGASNNLHENQ